MTTRVLMIDSHEGDRAHLRDLLSGFAHVRIVGDVASMEEGAVIAKRSGFDLALVGMETAGEMNPVQAFGGRGAVVLLSGHEPHVAEARDLGARGFLLKPMNKVQLSTTIQAIQGYDACGGRLRAEDTVPLNSPQHSLTVRVRDIVLIEAQENYTRVYLAGGAKAFVRQSLKSWDEAVPEHQFMRIHRQFIANLDFVESHEGNTKEGGWAAVRGNPARIRVGRRIWSDFFERLKAKSWTS